MSSGWAGLICIYANPGASLLQVLQPCVNGKSQSYFPIGRWRHCRFNFDWSGLIGHRPPSSFVTGSGAALPGWFCRPLAPRRGKSSAGNFFFYWEFFYWEFSTGESAGENGLRAPLPNLRDSLGFSRRISPITMRWFTTGHWRQEHSADELWKLQRREDSDGVGGSGCGGRGSGGRGRRFSPGQKKNENPIQLVLKPIRCE